MIRVDRDGRRAVRPDDIDLPGVARALRRRGSRGTQRGRGGADPALATKGRTVPTQRRVRKGK